MSEKKSLGNTVLGWFVVREDDGEDDAPPSTQEEVIQKFEKKAAAAPVMPPPVKLSANVPNVVAGTVPDRNTFTQVFRSASITDEEQGRVEKAISLLQSLPSETPKDVRKQIVEASLKAFGIPIDEIIEAGAGEIQALEAFILHGQQRTQDILTDAKARIEKLANDINEIKKLMELQVTSQQSLTQASNAEKLRIQAVLEFFGQEAVARVVKQSPKLVEPT